jgi:haloacetate dehalogenase
VLKTWREKALDVRGKALDRGHSLQEERPDEFFEEVSALPAENASS